MGGTEEPPSWTSTASSRLCHATQGCYQRRGTERTDGCATFWLTARYSLVHKEAIEFEKMGLRDNTALVVVLRSAGGDPIVVGNTHVLYNPKRCVVEGNIHVLYKAKRCVDVGNTHVLYKAKRRDDVGNTHVLCKAKS